MKILLVDDDPTMRTLLSKLLVGEGHEVDTCVDGQEALVQLRSATYAALLTDLVMPAISGLELVQQAHQLYPELRCMIITGQQFPPEAERGPATWAKKPLDFDALLAALEAR